MFAQRLRALRAEHGSPTYRKMSIDAGLAYSTLADGVRGDHMPTWKFTEAYLRGCGVVDDEEVREWRRAWQMASDNSKTMPSRPRLDADSLPDPGRIRTYADLIDQLRLLKLAAGNLPYRNFYFSERGTKGNRAAQVIPHSTISNMFTGKHISSRPEIYMQIVCGLVQHVTFLYGPTQTGETTAWSDLNAWRSAWIRALAHHRLTRPAGQHRAPDKGDVVLWIAADDPKYAAYLLTQLPPDRRDQVLQDLPLDVAASVLHALTPHRGKAA